MWGGKIQEGFFLPCLANGPQNVMSPPNLLGTDQKLFELIVH